MALILLRHQVIITLISISHICSASCRLQTDREGSQLIITHKCDIDNKKRWFGPQVDLKQAPNKSLDNPSELGI